MQKLLFSIAVLSSLAIPNCGPIPVFSENKSLELRENGKVYRFYLATGETNLPIRENAPEYKWGNQFLFGLGCYDEPSNPEHEVRVPVSSHSRKTRKVKLYERTKLHEFPVTIDESELHSGNCEVLFGEPGQMKKFSNSKHNTGKGDFRAVRHADENLVIICASAVGMFFASLYGVSKSLADMRMNLTEATTNVFLVSAGTIMNFNWCPDNIRGARQELTQYRQQTFRHELFNAMTRAERIADLMLLTDKNMIFDYFQGVSTDIELAAAIYNPLLVKAFNGKAVHTRLDNSKGGVGFLSFLSSPKVSEAFKAFRDVQLEVNVTDGKAFQSPNNNFGGRVHCKQEEIEQCRENDKPLACVQELCVEIDSQLRRTQGN